MLSRAYIGTSIAVRIGGNVARAPAEMLELEKLQQIGDALIRDELSEASEEAVQVLELMLLGTSMGRPKAVV
jgi:hypothetical protein